METGAYDIRDEFSYAVLPSQFNDLIRRGRAVFNGEHRLLWAVLEDAIRTFLANRKCQSRKQQRAFEEVSEWFFPPAGASQGLFGFQGVCDALGIDSNELIQGMTKLELKDLPIRRYNRALRIARIPRMAA